jgi:hypothetical protein
LTPVRIRWTIPLTLSFDLGTISEDSLAPRNLTVSLNTVDRRRGGGGVTRTLVQLEKIGIGKTKEGSDALCREAGREVERGGGALFKPCPMVHC